MKTPVVIEQTNNYESASIHGAVSHAIGQLGGWSALVRPGQRVLVKPNCICAAPPEQPAQTHPAMIVEVCRQLLEFGCQPFVGDSPAWGSLAGNLHKLGILATLNNMGVAVTEFKRPVRANNPHGKVFSKLTVDAAALEADAIVNLPKFKAHRQLVMTVAIKNMFGCVNGRRKALWHVKAGSYENYFARMLVETYQLLRPVVNIVDAVVAMEGIGPIKGTPRHLGLILASTDGAAIERIAADIVGIKPAELRTLRAARELEIGACHLDQIEIIGPAVRDIRVKDFIIPRLLPIGFSFPRLVRGTFKNAWIIHKQKKESEIER